MQLNTIAGRTYNDLSQYPVVSPHHRLVYDASIRWDEVPQYEDFFNASSVSLGAVWLHVPHTGSGGPISFQRLV